MDFPEINYKQNDRLEERVRNIRGSFRFSAPGIQRNRVLGPQGLHIFRSCFAALGVSLHLNYVAYLSGFEQSNQNNLLVRLRLVHLSLILIYVNTLSVNKRHE